jgi:hypothetical protein
MTQLRHPEYRGWLNFDKALPDAVPRIMLVIDGAE